MPPHLILALLALAGCALPFAAIAGPAAATERSWQPGDHHVHSEWSVDWDHRTTPPTPIAGGDSQYSRTRNAQQARAYGLTWMVHTDHGGPGHSRVNRDQAWPALQQARAAVPGLIQFHGMEFDVPAAEHASLIIAPGPEEREQLYRIERDYSRAEPLPPARRDEEAQMIAALGHLRTLTPLPLMLVNHPSRTATGFGQWGEVTPRELRAWNDAAPEVLVGMEGAPGHQAAVPHRGLYRNATAPTLGGFDQMTAQLGGTWDALLAEDRRFWITASSDSHVNQRDGGGDFDPGQYSKTYVWARREASDILDGLRNGRAFAVSGDLIDALELRVAAADGTAPSATLGETLTLPAGAPMRITLQLRQPRAPNAHGERPALHHVEVIIGEPGAGTAPRMRSRIFDAAALHREGDWLTLSWTLPAPAQGGFVRVRGSSTAEHQPLPDINGEDPWQDLWFYSNPVFIRPASTPSP
ncbi:MAG TPA: hypothetical protein VD865_06230 [Stenotrophomonas sp.]|nr:hypothetical protein [Stenotrophomonas sp.]